MSVTLWHLCIGGQSDETITLNCICTAEHSWPSALRCLTLEKMETRVRDLKSWIVIWQPSLLSPHLPNVSSQLMPWQRISKRLHLQWILHIRVVPMVVSLGNTDLHWLRANWLI